MKKFIFVVSILVIVIGVVWFFNQSRNTTFGEVFDGVFEDSDIYKVVIEEKQKKNLNPENEQILDLKKFKEIIKQSSEMKIKQSETPPMNTYELTIHYKYKGEEKVSAIVVGYNNTLQMPDGKFYVIKDRNYLFESIYRDL